MTSGDWYQNDLMTDYRSEWFDDMLVERATWREGVPARFLNGVCVAAPGHVWFRFWLPASEQLVEKYFVAAGSEIGYYMPITGPIERDGQVYSAVCLLLSLWLDPQGGLVILGEPEFEQAIRDGELSSANVEWAESHVRHLTAAVAGQRFPPALIRHLMLDVPRASGKDDIQP